MSLKTIIIVQLFVLCWNEIDVLGEITPQASGEDDIFSNKSGTTEKVDYSDNYPNASVDHVIDVYDDFELSSIDLNGSTAIIENLSVDKAYPEGLRISWTIIGTNVTTFFIEWFINDMPVGNATPSIFIIPTEKKFIYRITKLSACTKYKITVTPLVDGSFESGEVTAKTAETQPGAPLILTADPVDFKGSLSLNISWQRPKVGGFCVRKYAVSVETEIHDKPYSLTMSTMNTQILATDLFACTSYLVTVRAVGLNDEYGLSATIQSQSTPQRISEKPRLIGSQSLPAFIPNITSIIFNWYIFDEKNNCTIMSVNTECEAMHPKGYGYELKEGYSLMLIKKHNVRTARLAVENLSPYTEYTCYGKIVNAGGFSNRSTQVWVATLEDAPSSPQTLKLTNKTTFTFSWEAPVYMPGHLHQYKITLSWKPNYDVPDFCEVERQHVVDKIHPKVETYTLGFGDGFSNYNVEIAAYTGGGWSQNNTSIAFKTFTRGAPDKVTNLEYETKPSTNDSNVLQTTLSWNLPCSLRGKLKHFDVFVFGTKNHLANHTMRHLIEVPCDYDKNARFSIVLGELRPQHFYKFHVSATTYEVDVSGEVAVCETEYPAGIPPVPTKAEMDKIRLTPNKMPRTTTSIEVLLPLFNNTNGDIKFYAIIVSRLGYKYEPERKRFSLDDEKDWPNVSSWKEAMEKDFEIPYQVTEPRWTPYPNHVINYGSVKAVKYVIGEDVTCHALSTVSRLYCNGPLKPDTTYQVWIRAFTNGGYADSDFVLIVTDKEMSIYLIIGVTFGILVAGIAAAVFLTKMSRYKGEKNLFPEEESDLDQYRNRRRPISSNPSGADDSASATTRITQRRIDQANEQN